MRAPVKNSTTVQKKKKGYAYHFEREGAIAQLEERLPCTEEAAGSSPACSIPLVVEVTTKVPATPPGLSVESMIRRGWFVLLPEVSSAG